MDVWSWRDFVAGWAGGIAGLVVGHPADTIKVRQQAFPEQCSAVKTLQNTIKFEGIYGLYKGLSFPLVSAGAINALFFGVYGNTMRCLQQWQYGACEQQRCCEKQKKFWHLNVFIAGCVGGLATSCIACPVDIIKIQMQAQIGEKGRKSWGLSNEPRHSGVLDCVRKLYKKHGLKSFYKGFYLMLLRDVPSFGLYMIAYERTFCSFTDNSHFSLLHILIFAGGFADIASYGVYMLIYEEGIRSSPWNQVVKIIIWGGTAGAISWALITPLDVVKSRIQADSIEKPIYKGAWECTKRSYETGGTKVFFRGFWMMMIRSFPVNAATFVVYEMSLKTLGVNRER